MKNNIIKIMTLSLFGVILSSNVFAQKDTVYSESVIVNVGFNPIVNDANKITENPSIFDTSFSKINMKFDKIDKGYKTMLAFDSIKAAQVKGEPVATLYNLNVKVGMGMALSKKIGNGFTPLLQASYSSLRDRHLMYGVDIYSRSVIGEQKDYGHAGYSNNDINIWGKRIFNSYSLTSRAFYNYNRHYYYGGANFGKDSSITNPKDIKKKDYRTAWHNMGLDLAYTKLKRDNSFQHNAFFTLNYTTSKLKSREFDLHLLLDGSKTVNWFGNTNQTFGISFDYRQAFRKYKGNWSEYDTNNVMYICKDSLWIFNELDNMNTFSKTSALFNFSPYFIFDYNKFHIFASFAFIPKINSYNGFQILPTATVSFEVIQNILSLYGGFKSEAQLPTLYEITKENSFIAPSVKLQDETQTNLFAKIFVKISPNAQLSLEGAITDLRNQHFFYNLPVYERRVFNTMNIDYAAAKRYYATLQTHFNISSDFYLNFEATYQSVKREDEITAWYQPKFYTSLKATYKYEDKFFVTLTPTFKTKQKARFLTSEYELKAMVDINLEATYQYDDNWSFFIDLENLAFDKYQHYYEYPVYSFVGLVGAKYRF